MNTEALDVYLNDHKAGSVGAMDLLEHLVAQDGNQGPLVGILAGLRKSQATLDELFARLSLKQSSVKRAGAWLVEKIARAKSAVQSNDALGRLETLEMLALGIQGQIALWRSLQTVAPGESMLLGFDFSQLEADAREHHDQVEQLRMAAALAAFSTPP
jgi:hypothetical protein